MCPGEKIQVLSNKERSSVESNPRKALNRNPSPFLTLTESEELLGESEGEVEGGELAGGVQDFLTFSGDRGWNTLSVVSLGFFLNRSFKEKERPSLGLKKKKRKEKKKRKRKKERKKKIN